MLKSIFPFLSWIKELRYSWKNDLISGILIAIILIPQSLAYAQIAGMPARFGLYASFLPVIIASLWGSSKQLSTGPAVVVSLLTLTSISKFAVPGSVEFISLVALLALMVGIIQLIFGLIKVGNLIRYIAQSVILGFVNGAVVLIIIDQIPKILGIVVNNNDHLIIIIKNIFSQYHSINYQSLFLGLTSLLIIIIGKKYFKKFPVILLIVILSTIFSKYSGYSGSIIGNIPTGLPDFSIPLYSFDLLKKLFLPAFIVAIVAYVNSISISKTLSLHSKEIINPNQELIGQGLANISAGISGTIPVGGSFSRSAINLESNSKTGLSALVVGIVLAITSIFFMDTLYFLPKTVLAAIIGGTVINLIDFKQIRKLLIHHKYDGYIAIFSFLSTLIFAPHLDYGIILGIIFSIGIYVHRAYASPIEFFKASDILEQEKRRIRFKFFQSNNAVLVISIDHSLMFSNVEAIQNEILNEIKCRKGIRYIMFLSRNINFLDSTAVLMLEDLVGILRKNNITFIMVSVKPSLEQFIRKINLDEIIGKENIFKKANLALREISDREKSLKNK
ncbi:MAG: SulP family inorganic anion transporter [Pseudomonadales bacterium]|nr:SulP family inorganic anion transporter [Pseudomonadales bacterium]